MAVDTPTVVAVIALVGTLVTAVLTFRSSGRAADVIARAGELGWVKELRQDAIDARKEVVALQGEVRELRRKLEVVTREADYWIGEAQTFRRHVWRQGMTIARLRELVGPVDEGPPRRNGVGSG